MQVLRLVIDRVKVIIKHTIHFLILYLGSTVTGRAQDVDTILRHRFFITTAFNRVDSRDEQASPLLYYGNGTPLGFGYEYRGDSYRHTLRFSFSVSDVNANSLQPDLQDDPFGRKVFFTNGFLTYSYIRDCAKTPDGTLQYSYGLAFDNVGFLREYKYYGGDLYSAGGEATWEELNMLSPVIRVDYALGSSQKINSILMLPLISLVGRPGYNLMNTNTQIISGNNFHLVLLGGLLGWNYSLTFEQKIWDALVVSALYESRYYRYTRYGWSTSMLIQDIALQLSWRFGL